MTIPVAHDPTCPWCWVGLHQVRALAREYGVQFDWIGYELWPEELAWPEPGPPDPPENPNRPVTPSRMELAYAAMGMEKPTSVRPRRMRVHAALQAMEHAKTLGVQDEVVSALYEAYWLEGQAIGDPTVAVQIAAPFVADLDDLKAAIAEQRYKDKIVPFDDEAYAKGVYNVPTFFIGGERFAEQPIQTLRRAIEAQLVRL